jgi:hypothetical protein
VAAVSATNIWAVGSTTIPSDFDPTSIVLHYDGSQWTSVPVPNVGDLRGVAAIAANNVWAFGAAVLHWNGDTWSRVATPRAVVANFSAISAAGPDDIWIVGNRSVRIGPRHAGLATLAEHWDGKSWTVVNTPNPNPKLSQLIDVTTLSPDDAWIVGQAPHGYTMHWDGRVWRRVALPASTSKSTQMWGVGSDGAGTVWAVGNNGGRGYGKQVYLRWGGRAWQRVPGPTTTKVTTPSAISGTSSADVWAVGSAAGDRYVIARYDGRRWANVTADTAGVPSYEVNLADVATLAPTDAWAVGRAQVPSRASQPNQTKIAIAIFHWDGTSWRPQEVPGIASIGS